MKIDTLANRIKEKRMAVGLTQEALAEKAGLSTELIQKMETGKANVTKKSAEKLGAALSENPLRFLGKAIECDLPRQRYAELYNPAILEADYLEAQIGLPIYFKCVSPDNSHIAEMVPALYCRFFEDTNLCVFKDPDNYIQYTGVIERVYIYKENHTVLVSELSYPQFLAKLQLHTSLVKSLYEANLHEPFVKSLDSNTGTGFLDTSQFEIH